VAHCYAETGRGEIDRAEAWARPDHVRTLTRLQADALVTPDPALARAAGMHLPVASHEVLLGRIAPRPPA